MKLGIMQPYFLPYIGYFQLMNMVDKFVIYDNIEFTKRGWINRNRYLCNSADRLFSIPLVKDSDYLDVCERNISNSYNRKKLLNQIEAAYKRAPYYGTCTDIIERIIYFDNNNLFEYVFNSIKEICKYLEIDTELIISSDIEIDHELKAEKKVITICEKMCADEYINPIGGVALYSLDEFKQHNIKLNFIKRDEIIYQQFGNEFVGDLSILDVLMFNSVPETKTLLEKYSII